MTTPSLDLVPDADTGLTPADRHRAALAVCSYARDAEQARELLETLGLLEEVRGDRLLAG